MTKVLLHEALVKIKTDIETSVAEDRTAAETARTGAETAETNAGTHATAAQTARAGAETARTGAETAETNAGTHATNAGNSATASANSATASQNSATAAAASATAAENSATAAATSATQAAASAASANLIAVGASYPTIRPSRTIDFVNSRWIDPAVAAGYTRTGVLTWRNSKGVLIEAQSNVPALDYDPITGACLGFSTWETRTNLVKDANGFNNWTKTAAGTGTIPVVTSTASLAPDGTLTATTINFALNGGTTSSDNSTLGSQVIDRVLGTMNVYSIWMCTDDGTTKTMELVYLDGTRTTLTVTGAYQKFVLTSTSGSTGSTSGFRVRLLGSTTAQSATVRMWRSQITVGAFDTPHVPTGAATATRGATIATIAGLNFSHFFNATEGTLIVKTNGGAATNSNFKRIISLNDGTVNNRIMLGRTTAARGKITTGGVDVADFTGAAWSANTPGIIGIAWKANGFSFCFNGGTVLTDTSGAVPTGINQMEIGHAGTDTEALNGYIEWIRQYTKAPATTAEFQALCTI